MKLTVTLALVSIALVTGAMGWSPDGASSNGSAAVHDFEFKVEVFEKEVIIESIHGTSWKDLSWSIKGEAPMEFWLDDKGIASSSKDLHGSKFLIHFQ